MLVKEIMTEPVYAASPTDPVRKIAGIMHNKRVSGVPVVDEDGTLMGFISEKDILNRLLPGFSDFMDNPLGMNDFEAMEEAYFDILGKSVGQLMTGKRIMSISPDDPVMKAASQMNLHKFRRMPVVENGKLVGMASLSDIHKAIFKRELGLDHLDVEAWGQKAVAA